MGIQTCCGDWYGNERGCRGDVLKQTVPGSSSSNRKCAVNDGGRMRATDVSDDDIAYDIRRVTFVFCTQGLTTLSQLISAVVLSAIRVYRRAE